MAHAQKQNLGFDPAHFLYETNMCKICKKWSKCAKIISYKISIILKNSSFLHYALIIEILFGKYISLDRGQPDSAHNQNTHNPCVLNSADIKSSED